MVILLKSKGRFLKVGRESYSASDIFIRGDGKVDLGSYCAIGLRLVLITSNHNYNLPSLSMKMYSDIFGKGYPSQTKDVIIGNDVWIGDNVTILPGVLIGDGAVIGAGSVVTKDVADYSIVGGVPAKVIKMRFKEPIIDFLMQLKWWDWSKSRIKKNKIFFDTDLNKLSLSDIKKLVV